MKRDMGIFIKINTFGVIFTIIITVSIISIGIYALFTTDYEYVGYINNDKANPEPMRPDDSVILLFASQYSHLMGILGGGFYLHNISLPIYRNSKYPENNYRDMFIGFLVVCISYILCGVLGYYGFQSTHIFGPGIQIDQNFLNMFNPKNYFAFFIRICCFFQIIGSISLIFACQRGNIFMLFTGEKDAKSNFMNMLLNTIILVLPLLLSITYP